MTKKIEAKNLIKIYGDRSVVNDVSFEMNKGEVVCLLGPNGAGKTTTLKMLTTLLPPTSGDAKIAGRDIVHQAREVRRLIGYVPQMLSADGTLSGYENLDIFGKLYDIPRAERRKRVSDALEFMGLADSSNKLVRDYSGGMIRRLEVAQSFLHHPRVLFLDEPTTGLDPTARRVVWEHVDRLREEYGTTIVLTTHLMEEADRLCHRVAIMHFGKVAAIGTPAELKASLGAEEITLDDVFIHYAGDTLESGGTYRETVRTRRTAHRVG